MQDCLRRRKEKKSSENNEDYLSNDLSELKSESV
jgi:hypothetical protein